MPFLAGILTISDKGAAGEREDTSGAEIRVLLAGLDVSVERYEVIPDERATISERLMDWADGVALDLIVTTGGTGLGPRDVTPQATRDAIDYEAPGLAEAMRAEGLKHTPMAMLSRAVAGVRGRTLIVNLPGSPSGVRESLSVLLPVLPHALETLRGRTEHRMASIGGVRRNGGKRRNVEAISAYIQNRLGAEKLDCISAVEAARWLDEAGLLPDRKGGLPLRNLLRKGLIDGASQDPPGRYGRWSICKKVNPVETAMPKKEQRWAESSKTANRLPPSLKPGVDLVIVGVGPKPGGRSLRLGCYYADGRNSFWRDLYESGFTLSLFEPCDYPRLLDIVPSIGLDDLNDDAEGLWERLQECRPRVVVFNSKEARKRAQRDHYGRQILNAFECHALHDSSGRSAGSYRPQRLAALRALRRRFP